jgi:hypothetical protein
MRCSRAATGAAAFGPVAEVAFVVPGIATVSSSGYLAARPFFRVYGTAASVSLHRDGVQTA